jgi:RNA polymerase sigma-70 factor (ECF subfamily)
VTAMTLSGGWLPALAPWVLAAGTRGPSDRAADVTRDARLVALTRQNPSEFEHLVRLYERRVYATALRLTGSAADAEDISQEAFVRAFRALDRFDVTRPFGPWVCVIAANLARDHLRSPLRRFRFFGLTSEREERAPKRADLLVVEEAKEEVALALEGLSPTLRETLVLRFVSDMSIEEIATALDIGVSATKMRLKRGLEQMREKLGEETPLPDEID